jgi:hypothetical protein
VEDARLEREKQKLQARVLDIAPNKRDELREESKKRAEGLMKGTQRTYDQMKEDGKEKVAAVRDEGRKRVDEGEQKVREAIGGAGKWLVRFLGW